MERRKGNWTRALEALEREYELSSELPPAAPAGMATLREVVESGGPVQGTVIEIGPGTCRVEVGDRAVACSLRTSLKGMQQSHTNVVAVGDRVLIALDDPERQEDGDRARGVVEKIPPRRSALVRPDVFYPHLQQVIKIRRSLST